MPARAAADEREAARETTRRRAREAFEIGQSAFDADDLATAAQWFERAHRLARADRTIAFALALLRLRLEDAAGAAALLLPVVRAIGRRDALLSLAIARRMQGLAGEAACHLSEALSSHAVDPGDPALLGIAAAIAGEAGASGWCGVTPDGRVLVRAVERGLDVAVFLDGARVDGGTRTADGLAGELVLPPGWKMGRAVEIAARGRGGTRELLGARIDLRAVLRVEGIVEGDGGLAGWARHPNAPGLAVELTVQTLAGRTLARAMPDADGRFAMPLETLPDGPVRVIGPTGLDLLGSPVDPGLERRATAARAAIASGATGRGQIGTAARFLPIPADWIGPPPAAGGRRPGVAVVVPVHGGLARTLACLDSLATLPRGVRVHVVDDASPEPALVAALDERARSGAIALHRHPGGLNRGFPASANLGFVVTGARDVVLLNSDTLVTGDWLERLRRAAYAAPDIGTATPLTNEGSIFAYPRPRHANEMPDAAGTAGLHALASGANDGRAIDVPTGNGFCLYIRRACLDAAGPFREDLFAQGYGEENDFCLRARHAGWRHVAALDTYVAHAGSTSFGSTDPTSGREALVRRNLAILNRLHPGYDALIARFIEGDPIAPGRRRLDRARLGDDARDAVLLVTHQAGGGVERFVRGRLREIRASGRRPVVLRGDSEGERTDLCVVEPDGSGDLPNLRWTLPHEHRELLSFLRSLRPAGVEIHHLLGHHACLPDLCRSLGVPIDVWLHDHAWFCPRISLLGAGRTYCGEPPVEGCRRCVAEMGSLLGDEAGVDEVIARSAALLGTSRRIIAATQDAGRRMRSHFPGIEVSVSPWETAIEPIRLPAAREVTREAPMTVAVVGGIGPEKGIEVLIGCVRDAAARDLPMRFVVVGHTSEDDRLLAAGPAFVTGPYDEDETGNIIRAQKADLAFLPSIWPETWCYALSECWRAGLGVVAFDIGAQAERIGAQAGLLLPLGLSPVSINNRLLSILQPNPTSGLVTETQSAPWVRRARAGTVRARTLSRQEAD